MNLRLLLALFFTFINPFYVDAQDDSETPFPIDQRCVLEPIQPSDDWTYEGTLLMSGYAGIHAMQADWETPRITAFFSAGEFGEPHAGGQLSPDARWYAVPTGETWVEPSFNQYWMTYGLRLYSTVDNTELNFKLSEYDELLDHNRGYYLTAWTYQAVQWIDNDSLIIGSFLFNSVTDGDVSVEAAPLRVAGFARVSFNISPDWMRAYLYIPGQRLHAIVDISQPEVPIANLEAQAVAWLHDSTGFVAEQRIETVEQLSLFDRNGEFVQRLFSSEGGRLDIRHITAGRNELGWSHDNRYFVFWHIPPQSQPSELLILDMENQRTLNTCLSPVLVSQAVWSPYGNQVAFLMRARENLRVVILDLDTWTAYDVARHSGISGALLPGMIGWRENN